VRAVFMGTPEFAVPALGAMLEAGVEVAGVVTQPDRPAGRGREVTASPVKRVAVERGIEVLQPLKIKAPDAVDWVQGKHADVIVVVGYGQIIPASVFDYPKLGTVNVHASLLPKYRGAAPIQWAIANGETVTGVTTMRIEAGLDTGDILLAREVEIGPEETASELSPRLAGMGAELLIETLRGLEAGTITPRKQDNAAATYAPILKKKDGRVDWSRSARAIFNQVRGFDPWPGAFTTFRGELLQLRRVRVAGGSAGGPGRIEVAGRTLLVACGEGGLEVLELQPEAKRRMTAQEFLNGWRPESGEMLG